MSWSLNIIGKPAAVAAKMKEDLGRYKCVVHVQLSVKMTPLGAFLE